MVKRLLAAFVLLAATTQGRTQVLDSYVHSGEFGVALGAAHYFGDLNTRAAVNKPKLAAGAFFRKQLNPYIGIKLAANYAQVGYSDAHSKNEAQRTRNLSFNSSIWELNVSGDFNFFRFNPQFAEYSFTPYVSLGIGIFSYDPYAYLGGEKHYLRPLATEGQGNSLYPQSHKPYGSMAMCIPISVGFKYALNTRNNFFFEVGYRFTGTDYLDDVSGTYAPDAFTTNPNGTPSIVARQELRVW
jgi:hypothetical protein